MSAAIGPISTVPGRATVEGWRAHVSATPQGILIQPVTAKHIRRLRGSLKGSKAMEVFRGERKQEREL